LRITVTRDQCVRPGIRPERLGRLRSAFGVPGGTVTAGNSSPQADGAAALLMMSEDGRSGGGWASGAGAGDGGRRCRALSDGPGAGRGCRQALRRAGLTLDDMDLIELNEAFAVQVLACLRQWRLSDQQIDQKVNRCGGAIALGDPLGASGARIATTLIRQMIARDARLRCVGAGRRSSNVLDRRLEHPTPIQGLDEDGLC
jgi:acetyl-CoA acyltransferase